VWRIRSEEAKMKADIKLDGVQVVLEGDAVKVVAADVVIDSPERRDPARSGVPHRRALVHGKGDLLIISFAGDYRQVRVGSPLAIEGTLAVGGNVQVHDSIIFERPDGSHWFNQDVIDSLKAEIESLKARLHDLDGK
jgi:hypothetical protein